MFEHTRKAVAVALVATLALGASACGGSSSDEAGGGGGGSGDGGTIAIVGFAVPEAANKAIADEFNETDAGRDVRFKTSYGASGDQSRAVVEGLDADYVHFSVTSDVTRLVDEGLVADTWDDGPTKGVVSSSIVVFGVREGNPLGIEDWDDLLDDEVEIVTPNPASSGAARWNALAAYGQVIEGGGSPEEALEYVEGLYGNVVSLPSSGRDATTAFLGGTGNVFLTYENEAILARQNGEDFEYIVPDTTLLIENPGAVLEDAAPVAQDWLDFVLSAPGQEQFALKGFRPLEGVEGVEFDEVEGALDPSNPFPEVENLLTIADDFGSWAELSAEFFDEEDGSITQIISATGKGE